MFRKLTVNVRMAQRRPKLVVLLSNIGFSCVQTGGKLCVSFHYSFFTVLEECRNAFYFIAVY